MTGDEFTIGGSSLPTDIPSIRDRVADLARRVAEHEDRIYRAAIYGTDWDETAVLRVIHHRPSLTPTGGFDDRSETFTIDRDTFEVERYDDRAPPLRDHTSADPHAITEVATITRPLLEQLATEFDEIADLLSIYTRDTGGERP